MARRNFKIFYCAFFTLCLLAALAFLLYYLNERFLWGAYSYFISLVLVECGVLLFDCSLRIKLYLTLMLFLLPFLGTAFIFYLFIFYILRGKKRAKVGLYADKRDYFKENDNGFCGTSGLKTRYYGSGEELFKAYLSEIKKAKKEVYIYAYIIKSGESLTALLSVLFELLKSGVKVFIGADWFGSGAFYKERVFVSLKEAGARLYSFREPRLFLAPWDNVRAHAKVVAVDGRVLFLSSANLEDKSIKSDKNCGLKISGGLEPFKDVFAPLWGGAYGSAVDGLGEIKLFLTRTRDEVKEAFISLISQSEKTVDIVTPYLSFDKEMAELLERTARRGVRIRAFISALNEKGEKGLVTDAFSLELMERGVEVYRYTKEFLHSKILLVDNKLSLLGSANFDLRSSSFAVESLALLSDNRLIARVLEDLDGVLSHSKRQEGAKNTFLKSLTKKMISVFGPLV